MSDFYSCLHANAYDEDDEDGYPRVNNAWEPKEPEDETELKQALEAFRKIDFGSPELQTAYDRIVDAFAVLMENDKEEMVCSYINEPVNDWEAFAALDGIVKTYPDDAVALRLLSAAYQLNSLIEYKNSFWIKNHTARQLAEKAFETAQKLAVLGDTEALYETAQRYACGWGAEKNEEKAERLLLLAKEAGYPLAEDALSVLHAGEETKNKWTNAYDKWSKADEWALNAEAANMSLLAKGTIYSRKNYILNLHHAVKNNGISSVLDAERFWAKQPGFCCRMDLVKSLGKKAAKAGYPEGLYIIGTALENAGDMYSCREAWEYYADAEKAGSASAAKRCSQARDEQKPFYIKGLTHYKDGEYQEAFNIFYPLMLIGNPRAFQLCDEMLEKGQAKAARFEELRRVYLMSWQKNNDLHKALKLSEVYLMQKDYENAKSWCQKGIDAGMMDAYILMVKIGAYSGETDLSEAYSEKGIKVQDPLSQYYYAIRIVRNTYWHSLSGQISELDKAMDYADKALKGGIRQASELKRQISSMRSSLSAYRSEMQWREFEAQREREEAQARQDEIDRQRFVAQVGAEISARSRIYSQSFSVQDQYGNIGELNAGNGVVQFSDGTSGYVSNSTLKNLQYEKLQDELKEIYKK